MQAFEEESRIRESMRGSVLLFLYILPFITDYQIRVELSFFDLMVKDTK